MEQFELASLQTVFETLRLASCQDPSVLKPAEEKLKSWEIVPGYYSILMKIILKHDIDLNVRWLAILCLKNGVDRYWRKNITNGITDVEKADLRRSLLYNVREPVSQIAIQLAVIIAKIARLDYPREWSQLIPELLSELKSGDELVLQRVLLILYQVIKSLSTKRLAGDRKLFQELTANIYPYLYEQWTVITNAAQAEILYSDENCLRTLEKSLLLLKSLHKLTLYGFVKLHESNDACSFLQSMFGHTKTMLEQRKMAKGKQGLTELLEKLIIKMTKIQASVLTDHPLSFINFLQPTLELTYYYVFVPGNEVYLFEKFLILCLNRLKTIVQTLEYKQGQRQCGLKLKETSTLSSPKCFDAQTTDLQTRSSRAIQIKAEFFNETVLNVITRKLVTQCFLLTQQDLALWDSDPESFYINESADNSKYSLRPCTESLFLATFYEYKAIMSPILVELVKQNHAPVAADNLPAILAKDAVYNAVGLAAFELYDQINFDDWFMTTLSLELAETATNYRIVRRRVALLLGAWTGVKLAKELRPSLYVAMIALLQPHEDLVVRLSAAHTIKAAVDDFDFNTQQFAAFLEPLFGRLFALLKDVIECESKMQVLYILSFIIERMGSQITPYAQGLIQYLPFLWYESNDHNMLRCAIVSTLMRLVQALGTWEAHGLERILLAVIALSTDMREAAHVYLLEDGLELWLAVTETATGLTSDLFDLFKNMLPLLDGSSEYLKTCLLIIEAYVIMEPENVLQTYGDSLVRTFNSLMNDMSNEGITHVMNVIEIFLKARPNRAVTIVKPALPRVFEAIYRGSQLPFLMSSYLSVMARVILIKNDIFVEVMCEYSLSCGKNAEHLFGEFLDSWLKKMELVTQFDREKLLALALASMISTPNGEVLHRFCPFLFAFKEVMNDIAGYQGEDGVWIDSLVVVGNELPDDLEDDAEEIISNHRKRKRQLAFSDPVHTCNLMSYVRDQINNLRLRLTAEQFDDVMQTVDNETLENIRQYMPL